MTTSDVRWSCTAQLDLLGFSNHLAVTNWDIRTQTGVQAIERLSSLEEAIQLFEQEKVEFPELYPSGLQYIRFNDALFLGIDVEYLNPPPSQTNLTGGYSIDQLRKIHPQEGQTAFKGTTAESGGDVAKLLGLVARIHTHVNGREAEKSFPGCRTVVASGMRKCFEDRKGVDDFFSANFSVSTAFEAEKKGNSVGLKDNNLYVEDDVAMAISYCQPCHAILGFSKFIRTDSSLIDPYSYQCAQKNAISLPRVFYRVLEPIVLDIMKKRLTFRRLDPAVLTNLQLFKDYQRFSTDPKEKGQLEKEICDSLFASTPSLDEVNKRQKIMEYPFLSLRFSLDNDYSEFFDGER
ncbi:MAG: hypothetical protein KKH20_00935 [Proteobacteria bacterium]|nr:hypothetical protein [Desulfobacteraceae bacterium]MBU3980843.1 hypothetical protein [Pseudomonadota bacterium]MBU4099926.1 hypothetical protein [Pseudomonadota bacterium]MBU4127231.1 hypothetical protein [Pseudomonadota bacterium]MBU4387949.1 hypothetical protein [Pseudomonadota bacterium]